MNTERNSTTTIQFNRGRPHLSIPRKRDPGVDLNQDDDERHDNTQKNEDNYQEDKRERKKASNDEDENKE